MRKYLAYLTPETRMQVAGGMMATIAIITLLNFIFHWGVARIDLPFATVVANAMFVGGPFVVGFFVVADRQVRLMRELSLKSRKDGLTGLNNRRTFFDLAPRRLQERDEAVLLLLDADHFKVINDTYGHAVGDRCLQAISRHLKWNLRADDVAGRIGGEEFAILIVDVNLAQAKAIAQRLVRPIPFSGGDEYPHLSITLSVGAALASEDISLDRLLHRADEALYAAKEAGRACVKSWSDVTDKAA